MSRAFRAHEVLSMNASQTNTATQKADEWQLTSQWGLSGANMNPMREIAHGIIPAKVKRMLTPRLITISRFSARKCLHVHWVSCSLQWSKWKIQEVSYLPAADRMRQGKNIPIEYEIKIPNTTQNCSGQDSETEICQIRQSGHCWSSQRTHICV